MAQDLFNSLIFGEEKSADAMQNALTAPIEPETKGLFDTFGAGTRAGVKGLQSDFEYFKAAGQTLVGDKQGALQSVRDARALENLASLDMEGIQTFSEFYNEPTVEGFFTQVASKPGEILPSAVMSIGSAGAGAVAYAGLRKAAGQTSKKLTKRLIQEAAQATADGTATSAQKRIAQGGYEALREASYKQDLVRGGLGGAYASEFAPLTGSNVSEALEAGKDLDRGTAVRAGLVAIPQAAVGVLGEFGMAKLLQQAALKKSTGSQSVWRRLSADFIKSGAIEGTTETVQEAIAIQNRVDLEPTYAEADQNLRLAQGLFAGFFGGGAIGGAGSALGMAANSNAVNNVGDTVADVVDSSLGMMDKVKEMMAGQVVSDELTGNVGAGQTTEESATDINAQVKAMLNPSSKKEAVWISGEKPDKRFTARRGKIKALEIDGQDAYAAFIPGRGTIVSKNYDIVSEVLESNASDAVLAAALGYSNTKNLDDSLVVRAYDANNNIVSEETTNEANKAAAEVAARGLAPDGGSVKTLPIDEALADRQRRAESQPKAMDLDSELDNSDPLEQGQTNNEEQGDTEFEPVVRRHTYQKNGETRDSYQAVEKNEFEGIDEARQAFADATNASPEWSIPFYQHMSKGLLKTATNLQKNNPDELVDIRINADGSYRIDIETTPDTQKIRIRDGKGNEQEVSMSEFLTRSISKAASSLQKYRSVNITPPDSDKAVSVNPVDLMNAGRRLEEATTGSFVGGGTKQSSRNGLIAMLGQLQMSGYKVDIQGVPINDILNNIENPNIELPKNIGGITAGFTEGGDRITLENMLKPYVPGGIKVSEIFEVRDEQGNVSFVDTVLRDSARQDQDPVSDTSEIAENNARLPDETPLSRMNIEEVRDGLDTTQNRPRGGAAQAGTGGETRQSKPKVSLSSGVTYPFGEVNEMVTAFITTVAKTLKFKKPIGVISALKFRDSTLKQLGSYVTNRKSAKSKIALDAINKGQIDLNNVQQIGEFVLKLKTDGILSSKVLKTLDGLSDPEVIGRMIVERASFEITKPFTTDPAVAFDIAKKVTQLFDPNQTNAGQMYDMNGASLILLNDIRNSNEAGIAMVAAHELGHILFKEEVSGLFQNKALYKKLYAAFEKDRQKARDKNEPVPQWENEGFEEWYADQLAAWSKKETTKPKNSIDAHFKKVMRRFKQLWKKLSEHRLYKRANTLDKDFDEYMTGVAEARKTRQSVGEISALRNIELEPDEVVPDFEPVTADNPEPTFEQSYMVEAITDWIDTLTGSKLSATKMRRWLQSTAKTTVQENSHLTDALKLVLGTDTIMRLVDKSEVIADMFYVRSNTTGGLGFVKERQVNRDKLRADLISILGNDWTSNVTQEALRQAQSDTPTLELKNKKALEIRKYLEDIHTSYIEPSNTNIAFRENFFPVMLDLGAINTDGAAFIDLILQNDPTANRKKVENAVKRILAYQKAMVDDPSGIEIDEAEFVEQAADAEASRKLTANINPSVLAENGYLEPPEIALMSYIDRVTKRVEWNRATKDAQGNNLLVPALSQLDGENRETVIAIISAHLGHITPMKPFWRTLNSYLQFVQIVTLLPFATFASIPDFAGAIVNTREFKGVTITMKQIKSQIKDPKVAERLAYDIGVVMPEAAANSWMSQADGELMDSNIRKATDKFFQFTGLNYLTNLSRNFASGMGQRFLLEHAYFPTKRSERYLRQLEVTPEQIIAWDKSNFDFSTAEGQAVKGALRRYVESSVLRPNSAERPLWANDPRYALIWQLKSFLYSFNKVILDGLFREVSYRLDEDRKVISSIAPIMFLTAAAFLPLAMLGLELREYAKVGLSYAIPGFEGSTKYLRTNRMDWGTYITEVWDRAGLNGPASLLLMAQRSADWGNSGLATILGPTAESLEKIVREFPRVDAPITDRVTQPVGVVGAGAGAAALARAFL